ncbi:hypothetical protein SAMN05421505_12086 [Sinosporangium album]|uniref:Uncharacterized protein n=1 Tax=Sinosporangium album TaxID=504805 RepID=A0A1G8EGP9_9ACTN|nr:hypothetical protein [Sinosporangium album]SDH68859.1 hypothetical protein SAMN05421505_12086 [Sinosporangium album]
MSAEDLARADPVPVVLEWLSGHASVTGVLGGAGRVGPYHEPPYPRLKVADVPGGTDSYLTRLVVVRVQVEALGSVDGGPGKELLRRILYTALGALEELPRAGPAPVGPVIVAVRPAQAGGYVPEADGRPRYLAVANVICHPTYP